MSNTITHYGARRVWSTTFRASITMKKNIWLNKACSECCFSGYDMVELEINSDKSKISKRKNPVSINYYRDAGFLPDAMINYLGMMGWTMPDGEEKFTFNEMVKNLSFDRISLGGPVFDIQKLTWLNGLYLRDLSVEQFKQQITEYLFNNENLL